MGEGVDGPEFLFFPDSSSGQMSFWPILVEVCRVWFLGATVPVELGATLPQTHFRNKHVTDFNSQLRIFGWKGLVIFHDIKVGSIMLRGNVLHAATAETVASFFWRHWPEKHV